MKLAGRFIKDLLGLQFILDVSELFYTVHVEAVCVQYVTSQACKHNTEGLTLVPKSVL